MIVADETGTIAVVRGSLKLTEEFLASEMADDVRKEPGRRWVVIVNRLGQARVLAENALHHKLPDYDPRFIAEWHPSIPQVSLRGSWEEARAALRATHQRLDEVAAEIDRLEADDWELFTRESGYSALRDTRWPISRVGTAPLRRRGAYSARRADDHRPGSS